jgi:hypothetical protein
MENAYFSVISPEGCAAILWKSSDKAPQAAEVLKLTPRDLKNLKIMDDIIPEPVGGAHTNPAAAAEILRDYIVRTLDELKAVPMAELLEKRYQKYRHIGVFVEEEQKKLARAPGLVVLETALPTPEEVAAAESGMPSTAEEEEVAPGADE